MTGPVVCLLIILAPHSLELIILVCSFRAFCHCCSNLFADLLAQDEEDMTKRDYIFYLAVAHTRVKVCLGLSI